MTGYSNQLWKFTYVAKERDGKRVTRVSRYRNRALRRAVQEAVARGQAVWVEGPGGHADFSLRVQDGEALLTGLYADVDRAFIDVVLGK